MPALIGFDMLHYAVLNSDNIGTGLASYAIPRRIPGAVSCNINPNSAIETLFADNGPMDTAAALGKIDVEIGAADFAQDIQAEILGHEYSAGMIIRRGSDTPPWAAIGGRSLKSNGAYRYFWVVKGKFMDPESKKETKGDKVSFQTPTLKGAFVKRDCDDIWIMEYDSDAVDVSQTVLNNWFNNVPALADLPVSYTINPFNGASNISTGAAIVLKFNKNITPANMTVTNLLVKTAAGAAVTCTVATAADNRTVTITPTASLAANTTYNVTVKAAAGIAADRVTSFTTTAV